MKFFLSGIGNKSDNLKAIIEAVMEADRLGFDGVLMPDHYMWGKMREHRMPNAYSTLETWVTLTYLAAKTERIRLGTLVSPISFRPPGVLAKMLSTLDILSNGRVVLGVGAGWSQDEFDGYNVWDEPKVRVDKTKEGLELMIRLWTEDAVDFQGKHYKAKGAVLEPKPIQKPYPRLLFGGRGDRMLGFAGRYADICYIMTMGGESYEEGKRKVLRAAKRADRTNEVAFMAGPMGAREPYDASRYSDRIEETAESGAGYYLTAFPRDGLFDSMRRFTEEVMPSYK